MRVTVVRRALVVLGACVVFSVAASAVLAAIPGSDGAINGCYNNRSGALRVIDSTASCARGETAITWNQQGQQGIQGIQGLKGDKGDPGDPAAASTEMVTWQATADSTYDGARERVSTTLLEAGSIIDPLSATVSGANASCTTLNGSIQIQYANGDRSGRDHGLYLASFSSMTMTNGQVVDGVMGYLTPIALSKDGYLVLRAWCMDGSGNPLLPTSLSASFTFDWTHPGPARAINN